MAKVGNYVAAAEAAFIAGITDRDVSRLVDEHILPDTLYERREGRRFLKLSCAFANFYFATDRDLTRALRQDVIRNLWHKVLRRTDQERVLSLALRIAPAEWKVDLPFGQVQFDRYLIATQQRAQLVDRSYDEIVEDDAIMAGEPVFKGTRIPVWSVAGSLDADIPVEQIREAYPSLTKEQIELATVYAKVHPRRGRPRKLNELNPTWKPVRSKRIPPPRVA